MVGVGRKSAGKLKSEIKIEMDEQNTGMPGSGDSDTGTPMPDAPGTGMPETDSPAPADAPAEAPEGAPEQNPPAGM